MLKKILMTVCLTALLASPGWAQGIEDQIKETVVRNINATESENTEAMMETIHTQSPFYLMTKQQMQPLFENYDLDYELLSYDYIGQTGEYATARVIFRTNKVSGPAFRNNELDIIQIFKQEDGMWKLWSQANLDVKFTN